MVLYFQAFSPISGQAGQGYAALRHLEHPAGRSYVCSPTATPAVGFFVSISSYPQGDWLPNRTWKKCR
jgi:hypothetical protein